MLVAIGHAETADRVVLEVKLDQHGRLVAHHPAIVTRLDDHHLRSAELHDAAVLVLNVDLPRGQKPGVGMHAKIGTADRFHVL